MDSNIPGSCTARFTFRLLRFCMQATFFKMRSLFFENDLDSSKHLNILYGLGVGANFSSGKASGGGDRQSVVWEEG